MRLLSWTYVKQTNNLTKFQKIRKFWEKLCLILNRKKHDHFLQFHLAEDLQKYPKPIIVIYVEEAVLKKLGKRKRVRIKARENETWASCGSFSMKSPSVSKYCQQYPWSNAKKCSSFNHMETHVTWHHRYLKMAWYLHTIKLCREWVQIHQSNWVLSFTSYCLFC